MRADHEKTHFDRSGFSCFFTNLALLSSHKGLGSKIFGSEDYLASREDDRRILVGLVGSKDRKPELDSKLAVELGSMQVQGLGSKLAGELGSIRVLVLDKPAHIRVHMDRDSNHLRTNP